MKKLLFISSRLNSSNKNGAYLASKRNFENLFSLNNLKVDKYIIFANEKLYSKIFNIFLFNRMEEITLNIEKEIISNIKEKKYDIIFLDGSGFGYLAEKIRKNFPKIRIVVFCHDINYFLFSSILKESKKTKKNLGIIKNLVMHKRIRNSFINEKKVFKNANIIITFNKRDTKLLLEKYNYMSNYEINMTFKVKKEKKVKKIFDKKSFNIIFVGVAALLPNIRGLEFFIDNVLGSIESNLYIIGKGMEKYKQEFENKSRKVKVLGTVDSLDEYYMDADAVISPIFSGGGMKIKTGEALSYWKTIFGTTEAFEGYELDYDKVGGLCDTAEEFIEKINTYIKWWEENNRPKFNEYSKNIFKERYSYDSSIKKFQDIFEKLEKNN